MNKTDRDYYVNYLNELRKQNLVSFLSAVGMLRVRFGMQDEEATEVVKSWISDDLRRVRQEREETGRI